MRLKKANFTAKHLCCCLFLITLQAWKPTQMFSCEIGGDYLFSQNTSGVYFCPSIIVQKKCPEAVTRRCSVKKVFLDILQNSQENSCARVSFLIKLQVSGLQLWHRCFPLNFTKFLRTPFLQNTSGRLLLANANMNNLTVFLWDLPGTYHGIHGSPVYLQEKNLEKNIVCQRKSKQLTENSSLASIFSSLESCCSKIINN